jgi:hypothetical protein
MLPLPGLSTALLGAYVGANWASTLFLWSAAAACVFQVLDSLSPPIV